MASRGREDDVHLVTSANRPHSEEVSGRARKYLISMGIRTVCLVLAIFVLHGWLRLVGVAAALILPWFAVVMANAGPLINNEEPEFVTLDRREIGAGREQPDDEQSQDEPQEEPAEPLASEKPPAAHAGRPQHQ